MRCVKRCRCPGGGSAPALSRAPWPAQSKVSRRRALVQVYDRLASLGCGHAQGYFISRPLPNEALLAWLDKHKPEKGRPVPVTAPAGAPVLSQR